MYNLDEIFSWRLNLETGCLQKIESGIEVHCSLIGMFFLKDVNAMTKRRVNGGENIQ